MSGQRDPCRSPMQWDDSNNSGFTSGENTWLPVNPSYLKGLNIQDEIKKWIKSSKCVQKTCFNQKSTWRIDTMGIIWILCQKRSVINQKTVGTNCPTSDP